MLIFTRATNFVRGQYSKLKKDFDEAPPAIRDLLPSGFAAIGRNDGTGSQIGVLVFELYELELAKVEGKPTNEHKIEAFKKALIPLAYPKTNNNMERTNANRAIQEKIENAYQNCYQNGMPIPPAISKLQASYYLERLNQAGLKVIEINGVKASVDTVNQPKLREKMVHYLAQWAAWSITLSIAFATAMTVSLWLAPLVFAITYFAKKSGNDFGMYDVAEELLRSAGWALSRKLGWEGKLDRTKALNALGFGVAIIASSWLAAHAAWVGTLLLPGWGLLTSVLPSAIMGVLQVAIPGYLGVIAGIATLAGSIATTRFFCNLSPWDNQIPFERLSKEDISAFENKVKNVSHNDENEKYTIGYGNSVRFIDFSSRIPTLAPNPDANHQQEVTIRQRQRSFSSSF